MTDMTDHGDDAHTIEDRGCGNGTTGRARLALAGATLAAVALATALRADPHHALGLLADGSRWLLISGPDGGHWR